VEAKDLEANPEETEVIVEWQEITNETAVHSVRTWRKEMMACQETTEARLECKQPTSEDTKPQERCV
jgi:hypothetical protein